MSTQNTPRGRAAKQDAIDINDFVYAATGARVRRLTLPDGTHWFPAADVATELGYVNTRQALLWHVPKSCFQTLGDLCRSVYGVDTSQKSAGQGLKKSMNMVNLQGLILLVNACTKPESEPFKDWVTEVIAAVQRDGSYALEKAPVQPAPSGAVAYAMPQEVADAIVRLEERNLRLDEEHATLRREEMRVFGRIADSLDRIADRLGSAQRPDAPPRLTADAVLADWKNRHLVVTGDIWSVAAYILPALVNDGEAVHPLGTIARRTGLTEHRVHDSLRILLKRGCIRQTGVTADGTPRYVMNR
ncbi:Bro-N domain-containing protein [Streptomyces sp. NPDC018019]|uniref:Bro-N domain-containing protein n=1 Tax=Streptomyces sp. NPDC018019 TaxID=3365030 RepID=UPI00379C584A